MLGNPPKQGDQGTFPYPHTCPSYTVTASQDERQCLASFPRLSSFVFSSIRKPMSGVWQVAWVSCNDWRCLDPRWAAEDTCSWASSQAVLTEEVPNCKECKELGGFPGGVLS